MPCDYSKYPSNWKSEIRPRILERAGNKCEQCGVPNGEYGYRNADGMWYSYSEIINALEDHGYDYFCHELNNCFDKLGNPTKAVKIVLTIAHILNPDPMDCRDENLQALCQRCHNKMDAPMRRANAIKTINKKKKQQDLFPLT